MAHSHNKMAGARNRGKSQIPQLTPAFERGAHGNHVRYRLHRGGSPSASRCRRIPSASASSGVAKKRTTPGRRLTARSRQAPSCRGTHVVHELGSSDAGVPADVGLGAASVAKGAGRSALTTPAIADRSRSRTIQTSWSSAYGWTMSRWASIQSISAGGTWYTATSGSLHWLLAPGRCGRRRRLVDVGDASSVDMRQELRDRLDPRVTGRSVANLPDRGEGNARQLRQSLRAGMAQRGEQVADGRDGWEIGSHGARIYRIRKIKSTASGSNF